MDSDHKMTVLVVAIVVAGIVAAVWITGSVALESERIKALSTHPATMTAEQVDGGAK